MKYLLLLAIFVFSPLLYADKSDLQTYLNAVENTDALKSQFQLIESKNLSRQNAVLADGYQFIAQLGRASSKVDNKDSYEYSLAIQKPILFGSDENYLHTLEFSADTEKKLQLYKLQNYLYKKYISSCMLQEKIAVLKDEKIQNEDISKLMKLSVQAGELDMSALLRSELRSDNLKLKTQRLKDKYEQSLQELNLFSNHIDEPQCNDISFELSTRSKELLEKSILYKLIAQETQTNKALHEFKNRTFQKMNIGIAYDNEVDLTRSSVYIQLPLSLSQKNSNTIEALKLKQLSSASNQIFLQRKLEKEIALYELRKKNALKNLHYINDTLVLKAYKSAELMKERFKGGEANYLEFINSQTLLFALLINAIETKESALLQEATLYEKLGISPLKETK